MAQHPDQLALEDLLQESINFVGDHFQLLFEQSKDFKYFPVDLFAKYIKSNRIILNTNYWTVMPAIHREKALASITAKYVKFGNYSLCVKDTWPSFGVSSCPSLPNRAARAWQL